MLNAGARRGDAAVTPLLRGGNTFGCVAPALDVELPAGLFERTFALSAGVAPVGVHRFAGIARIEHGLEYGGVGHCGIGDDYLAQQLVALVHTGVQLVAEIALTVLLGPARVDILLRAFVRLPAQRHSAVLDDLGFLSLVALDRRLGLRGIDDLAAARHVAVLLQLLLDLLEDERARAGLRQAVAEQPDRLGVGNAAESCDGPSS